MENRTLKELQQIAKEKGLRGYQNLRKGQLIGLLKRENNKLFTNLTKIIVVVAPIVLIMIGYKSCSNSEKLYNIQKIRNCDLSELSHFDKRSEFNVIILDFEALTSCNSELACENLLARNLGTINKLNHQQINVILEKCSSTDLNLFDEESYSKYARKTNSDLVIYGVIEQNQDSSYISINFAMHPALKNNWLNENFNQIRIQNTSILKSLESGEEMKQLKDIILLNMSQKMIHKDSINNVDKFRKLLDNVSNTNSELKSISCILKAISFQNKLQVTKAKKNFNKAIEVDRYNIEAYHMRGVQNLILKDYKNALDDIYFSDYLAILQHLGYEVKPEVTTDEFMEIAFNNFDLQHGIELLIGEIEDHDLTCDLRKYYYNFITDSIMTQNDTLNFPDLKSLKSECN